MAIISNNTRREVARGRGASKKQRLETRAARGRSVAGAAAPRTQRFSSLSPLIAAARAEGLTRLSLETGVQPTFIAARALYARAGFVTCGPFEGYHDDPNSLFMTLSLA